MSMNTGNSARPLLPKSLLQEDPHPDSMSGTDLKRKRQSTACTACQRKRIKVIDYMGLFLLSSSDF
ncbi:hypothetical protein BDV23DRAFT_157027 [Aspergillus alliaceus]|uniref:Uncharacterized protein n=1 Tax=Petromyces alliaceus TaxID=209559 RepID=A0A5N7C631_PETAA|nr:hypothetical protein BDV23DRAFT_157027 [Aspergillus alliaceus]